MNIVNCFLDAIELEASDLFVSAGKVPSFRVNGTVLPPEDGIIITAKEIISFRNSLLDDYQALRKSCIFQ